MSKFTCYAVKEGNQTGIFDTWNECHSAIKGYPKAKFKGFKHREDAEIWLGLRPPKKLQLGVIHIWTDGCCLGNPGPGAWAFVAAKPQDEGDPIHFEKAGFLPECTNNQAELSAMLAAMKACRHHYHDPIFMYSDSQYVLGILDGHKASANKYLVDELRAEFLQFTKLKLIKVSGHSGNMYNDMVDKLAQSTAKEGSDGMDRQM